MINLSKIITSNSKLTEAQKALEQLKEEISAATSFVKHIESGELDVTYEELEEKTIDADSLLGSLVSMRDQLKKLNETEQQRKWVTEGLAFFSEVLRKNQENLDETSFNIISNLVKYIKANQGAIYIVDLERKTLDQKGCYAYNRRKYTTDSIGFGEGLVGQVYLEKETLFLTDVPSNYIKITSGLGEAPPNSVVIVPLKINEEVLGIIELASFKTFETYQVEFLEKLGENIASVISTVKINEKTRDLLQQSQEQAESLRSQEEELRQNMEELSATQEGMKRMMEETQDNEAFLTGLINSSADTIFTVDKNLKLVLFNEVFRKTWEPLGLSVGKGVKLESFYPDREEWAQHKSMIQKALSGESFSLNLSKVVGDDELFFRISYSPIRNQAGDILAAAVFATETTEEAKMKHKNEQLLIETKEQEEILRQNMEELSAAQEEMRRVMGEVQDSDKFMRGLIDSSSDIIFTFDHDLKLIKCNNVFRNAWEELGVEVAQGKDMSNYFKDPKEWEEHSGMFKRVLAGEQFSHSSQKIVGDNVFYVSALYNPIYDHANKVIAAAVFARDVTEEEVMKKKNEQLLIESRERTEELAAQEEELRQNMEELSAAQEEMARVIQEISDNEEFIKGLIDSSTDTIFTVDQELNLLVYNEVFRETWEGQGLGVAKGTPLSTYYNDKQEWEKHAGMMRKVLAGEQFSITTSKVIGDVTLHLNAIYSPIRNQEGDVVAAAVFARDVTEAELMKQKNELLLKESVERTEELAAQEEELRQNMEELSTVQEMVMEEKGRMESFLNSTPDSILIVDREENIIHANAVIQNALAEFGLTVKAGMSVYEVIPPHDHEAARKDIAKALTGKSTRKEENLNSDTVKGYLDIHTFPLKSGNEIIGAAIVSSDISARKALEFEAATRQEELMAHEEELRQNIEEMTVIQEIVLEEKGRMESYMNSTTDSIFILDREEKIIQVNSIVKATFAKVGVDIKPGTSMYDLIEPSAIETARKDIQKALAGKETRKEEKYESDAATGYFDSHTFPLWAEGKVIGVAMVSRDITERKTLEFEAATRQEELMASEEELRQNMEEMAAIQEDMQRSVKESQENEAVMRGLMNATSDDIFTLDSELNLLVYNDVFRKKWEAQGFKLKKGLPVKDLYADQNEWKEHKGLFEKALAGEYISLDLSKKFGEQTFKYNLICNPIKDFNNKVTGAAIFARPLN